MELTLGWGLGSGHDSIHSVRLNSYNSFFNFFLKIHYVHVSLGAYGTLPAKRRRIQGPTHS